MSESTFRINKVCQHCRKIFEAQKTTTKYCSHNCSRQNWRLRKKLDKKTAIESSLHKSISYTLKADQISIELIRHKDFLSVREVAVLLSCNRKTVYKMIDAGKLIAHNFSEKKTTIRRSDIEKLFESKVEKIDNNCWLTLAEIQEKFKISYNGLLSIIKRNSVQTEKRGNRVFVNEADISAAFTK